MIEGRLTLPIGARAIVLSIILAVDIDGTRIDPGRVRTRVTEFYPGKSGFCLIRVQPGFVVRTRLNYNQIKMAALLNARINTNISNTAIQRTATDTVQQLGYK